MQPVHSGCEADLPSKIIDFFFFSVSVWLVYIKSDSHTVIAVQQCTLNYVQIFLARSFACLARISCITFVCLYNFSLPTQCAPVNLSGSGFCLVNEPWPFC